MNDQKPIPQVALEVMMKRNREEADQLLRRSKELLADNRKIEVEMTKILSISQPPPSAQVPPSSMRPDPMGGLLHAVDALTRSWQRRHKKNFKQLEIDLMSALEKVNSGRP